MNTQLKPIAIPLARAHELVGCSRTQFSKVWVDGGLVKPLDMGGRGLSVLLSELETAIEKRAAAIRSGELVPPIRSSRGRAKAQRRVASSAA